jgi:predicted nucleotidyltransferase
MQQEKFKDELWSLCGQYFDRYSHIRHYLGIARGAMETATDCDSIKIKKLFYVLRPLLAAKWCAEKNSAAPMSILSLMTLTPENLQQITADLITLKSTTSEGYTVKINPEMKHFIECEFDACTKALADIPKINFDVELADAFFRKTIQPQ